MLLQTAINIVKRLSHKGQIDNTSDEDTSIILDSINLARRDILLTLPKGYLRKTGTISVVQGTTTYALASDVQKPLIFRFTVNNTERFLKKVESETEFYRLIYSATANQREPTHYFEAGLDGSGKPQIIIYPTPDASYTVNYTYFKTWTTDALTTANLASEIPEIPLHLHNQVCMGGVFYTLAAFDDPKTNEWEGRFLRGMSKANDYEEEDQDSLLAFRLKPTSITRY